MKSDFNPLSFNISPYPLKELSLIKKPIIIKVENIDAHIILRARSNSVDIILWGVIGKL